MFFVAKAQLSFSFTKMRISEQDVVLSDCVRKFPCLYDKRTPKYNQRDVTGNCWKEVANKAGLENEVQKNPETFLLVKIGFTQNLRLTF